MYIHLSLFYDKKKTQVKFLSNLCGSIINVGVVK